MNNLLTEVSKALNKNVQNFFAYEWVNKAEYNCDARFEIPVMLEDGRRITQTVGVSIIRKRMPMQEKQPIFTLTFAKYSRLPMMDGNYLKMFVMTIRNILAELLNERPNIVISYLAKNSYNGDENDKKQREMIFESAAQGISNFVYAKAENSDEQFLIPSAYLPPQTS